MHLCEVFRRRERTWRGSAALGPLSSPKNLAQVALALAHNACCTYNGLRLKRQILLDGGLYREMPLPVILSFIQTRPLLEARRRGETIVEISLDLSMSRANVMLDPEGVSFPGGERLDWVGIEKISQSEVNCYTLDADGVRAIQTFSEETNRVCSLMPTRGAPSMLIAGFVMHRIKDVNPWQDTQRKIAAIAPVSGAVLDTATGLGYTAILAARSAGSVTTIELDPGAQAIARLNPWSQELFISPKITQIMGDAYEIVPTLASESFERIIHDPPTFSRAGERYAR